jgi:lactate dehydrogenase-like 2-hydroxyacid dehydrogenase
MKQVLVVGNFFPSVLDDLKKDFDVTHMKDKDAVKAAPDADLAEIEALASFGWAPKKLIERLPKLKLISSFGVGYDGVDVGFATKKGIVVGHTPDVLNDDVANCAIALLLATTRRLVAQDKYLREGRWVSEGNAPLTHTIRGKVVGIVGLGRIGLAIAEKLSVFGCETVYHSRSKKDAPHRYYGDLVAMARDADALIVITPGGAETEKLIDRQVIEALGPESTLINVARGSVCDEAELVKALADGRLGSAGLDVFEEEPKVPEALFAMDNVVLTPHVASATWETRQAMADLVVENVTTFFETGRPKAPVPESEELLP